MKGTPSNEEKIAGGFTPAYIYAYGRTEEEMKEKRKALKDYCMVNCLWIMKEVTDIGDIEGLKGLLYTAGKLEKKTETLVIYDIDVLGEGYEGLFHRYILGTRGFLDIRTIIPFKDEYKEMMEVFVRKEREIRTDRMERIKWKSREDGHYCGGRLPYGYYSMSGRLFVDKYESFVVKFIFHRLEQGASFYAVGKELNLRGFHNRSGKPFTTSSIISISKRKRFFQGYLTTQDGREVKGDFTPLLSEEGDLVSSAWVNEHFDTETEERIAKSKRLAKEYDKRYYVTPYLVEKKDGKVTRKKVKRRKKNGKSV